jgi:hypothetical protein
MLFYNAAGMQVTDDMHTHNCINTIQKLCFCYILFFLFFGRENAVNAFLQKLLDDIVFIGLLLEYLFQTCTSQSWEYFELYTVETRMAIFICSIYVKYYGNAVCVFLKYHCQ